MSYIESNRILNLMKKKMAFVDNEGMYHPVTRNSPNSTNWICHNRNCKIHKICVSGECTMGCDDKIN